MSNTQHGLSVESYSFGEGGNDRRLGRIDSLGLSDSINANIIGRPYWKKKDYFRGRFFIYVFHERTRTLELLDVADASNPFAIKINVT